MTISIMIEKRWFMGLFIWIICNFIAADYCSQYCVAAKLLKNVNSWLYIKFVFTAFGHNCDDDEFASYNQGVAVMEPLNIGKRNS